MRNLLNPKWLFLINTLPITLLIFLFLGDYHIIKSLLTADNIHLWKIFGFVLLMLGIINFGYTLILTLKKQQVSIFYGFIALFCYIPFIYLFFIYGNDIIPFTIPQWMVSGNTILYVGTFLMPTLIYSLFVIVAHLTPETKEHKAWLNFLIAIAIPVTWFIFSQIILPFWKPLNNDFDRHLVVVFIIIGTLVFLFFVIRAIAILATKKATAWQKYQLVWKIPISIILPLTGLAVNNGFLFNNFGASNSGIFGDFSNYWFYVLAVLNGVVICLPNRENKIYRLLLFVARSITFAYTFYFFLVFLPFLPLSILAIIALGTGFLMLAPLMLFVVHINELSKDFAYLKNDFSQTKIWIISVTGFLIIPLVISSIYMKDRLVLNQTLAYLYSPDYSKTYYINKTSIQKTINVVKHHKDRNQELLLGNQIPYLSSLYNWIVLDNLTLSDSKINNIEKVFFGNASFELWPENIRNYHVKITNITTKSSFDKAQNAWLSWVDLEISNIDTMDNSGFSEFATTIKLPDGAWISDYYLNIGDKKEMGILAEKKSAMWVFSNIRNENRDPGILYYLTGNKIAFRVFPFSKGEVRKTGLQILHKEPISFKIDSNTVHLGNQEEIAHADKNSDENVVYVSAKQKQLLKLVQRRPYFNFIVDVSKNNEKNIVSFTNRIEEFITQNNVSAAYTKMSYVNSFVNSTEKKEDWKQVYKSQIFEGGFFLERGIKTALFNSYIKNDNTYPIIVVVTDSIDRAILNTDFADLKMTFPESDLFFELDKDGQIKAHSLTSNPKEQISDSAKLSLNHFVLEYQSGNKKYYLPNNNEPSIILLNDIFEVKDETIKEKNWQSALMMQGKWNTQILHPETSDKEWLHMVKYSFISKVMTPVTSYLVVENEAQKAILKKKQEQVLSSNKSLDLGEDAQRMSEPGVFVLSFLLLLALWIREKRKIKSRIHKTSI